MKKAFSILLILIISITIGIPPSSAAAKTKNTYYKSAKTGKFTTKSYAKSHPSTTYKSYYSR